MAKFKFNMDIRTVEKVNTLNRKIITKIPVPESMPLLDELKKYESTNAVQQLPVVWDKAKNHQIFDSWGNVWIDFTSTIFVTNSGHGNERIIKRIEEQLDAPLLHSYYYPTKIKAEFLKKFIDMVPQKFEKAILLSGGTEASERAMKIARIHGTKVHKKKNILVAGVGNYHGKTMGAQMLSGQDPDKTWIGYHDPNIKHLPFPYPWVLEKNQIDGKALFYQHMENLKSEGVRLENIAAFFVESFQGWGAIFYPKEYIKAMRKWATNNNTLLIFDEIQAGFGRTGKFFAYEHYEVEADLVICGKGISGSMPLSAVIGNTELIELDDGYTSTHGGNPLACAAGLGNLEAFEKENLLDVSKKKEKLFLEILNSWKVKYPSRISMILGKGMLFGVFITKKNSEDLDHDLTNYICQRAMEKGVFSICTGRGTLKLGPPLSIPEDALIEGLGVYEECFNELF